MSGTEMCMLMLLTESITTIQLGIRTHDVAKIIRIFLEHTRSSSPTLHCMEKNPAEIQLSANANCRRWEKPKSPHTQIDELPLREGESNGLQLLRRQR
mmetsp:Transcript_16720/g.38607  ORF Transcript_16720/g.38607 Transcript_16720/m.38607 type:complete len:98 (-) Transcript_16720:48-341(-)